MPLATFGRSGYKPPGTSENPFVRHRLPELPHNAPQPFVGADSHRQAGVCGSTQTLGRMKLSQFEVFASRMSGRSAARPLAPARPQFESPSDGTFGAGSLYSCSGLGFVALQTPPKAANTKETLLWLQRSSVALVRSAHACQAFMSSNAINTGLLPPSDYQASNCLAPARISSFAIVCLNSLTMRPNPSFEPTATGKPASAAQLKR